MPDPELFPLTSRDASDVRALYARYRVAPYSEARIAAILDALPALGARQDGRLVGFVYCEAFAPDIAEVGSLYVDADHRGRGIGSLLLGAVHDLLRERNFKGAVLYNSQLYETHEPKRPAAPVYERMGYEKVLSTGSTDLFVLPLV
ncbi:MAG: GNAT family N-acetyltransferase [Litorimonas sp.]